MADGNKFSEQMIELAERFADVADAAQGRPSRRPGRIPTSWVLLPAAGAGLYALVRSEFFAKRAKRAVEDAKARAAELPEDLQNRVTQFVDKPAGADGAQPRRRSSTTRKSTRRASTRKSGSAG